MDKFTENIGTAIMYHHQRAARLRDINSRDNRLSTAQVGGSHRVSVECRFLVAFE